MQFRYYLLVFTLFLAVPASAQKEALMQQFRTANSTADIRYDYKVVMYQMPAREKLDSLKGSMYVKDGQYIDSSAAIYTARVGNYFCRLDHKNLSVTIANMTNLSRRLGIRTGNHVKKHIFQLTDSLVARQGNYVIETTDPKHYRLKMTIRNYPVSYVQIDFDKTTYKMTAAYYESEEQDPEDRRHTYLSKMQLTNISSTRDRKMPDLSGIFTLSNSRVVLNKKYAKYTLVPIEQ